MSKSCTSALWVETGSTVSLQKLIVPGQREEGENALHILLPPTPFSSLASNETMSHMVEYTVPDEFTVSIPPRMGLVLIVCTCTHSVEKQAPLLKNKDFKESLIGNYSPITFEWSLQVGCNFHQARFVHLGTEKETVNSFLLQ